ncbi:MAG: MarR family transcriptional regulator [Paenibacillus sp.]|uniref:DNA-binding transcriptional regulator, MarR family n=1 Tax=Paenibacillus aquistagni TaxID=1852522 RepID=A0A1X7JDE2_9BACL|nr:MarR family transcriptional regulator [Paenibacillus aquistagni]MBR2568792.1 MarR family transcriptional regulator [Paenibacillus sp.]NMM54213.1 MarR family transcriptional regulator [Paenibacillus aquistagni]SMG25830.1 DNA-binding transcriptional regulator, MarR family [Paenibacillus aquistagni]
MYANDFSKQWSKLTKEYKSVMDDALAPSLTESQLIVLEHVAEYGRVKPSDLLPHLATTPAAVTTLLDRMEKNALIMRERDQADRRIVWVSLTAFGEQEMKRGISIRETYWNSLLDRISLHNQQLLLLLLNKLTATPSSSANREASAETISSHS